MKYGLPYIEKRVSDGALWTFSMEHCGQTRSCEGAFVWPSEELAKKACDGLNWATRGLFKHSPAMTDLPPGTPYYVIRIWRDGAYVDQDANGYMYRELAGAKADFKMFNTMLRYTVGFDKVDVDLDGRDWTKPEYVDWPKAEGESEEN